MSMNAKGQSPDPAHGAAERAEKIKAIVVLCSHKSGSRCYCVGSIAAEIRAAVEEGSMLLLPVEKGSIADAYLYEKAKADAYADAISLIDTLLNSCDPSASQRIALNRAKSVIGARAKEVAK